MKKFIVFFTFLMLFVLSGCGDSSEKNAKLIANYPANLLKEELLKEGKITPNQTVYGIKVYELTYTTIDEEGKKVKASGVVVIPSDLGIEDSLQKSFNKMINDGFGVVIDCHGTIFSNDEAPSVAIKKAMKPVNEEVIFSGLDGFVTLEPDYIGYGISKGHYHPYLLKKSSAKAVVDFTKAALSFLKHKGIKTNGLNYLTGYSQGGYVALAALKEFEKENFFIKMASPMAGPYLLDPIAKGVLSLSQINRPSFIAAVAYAYSKAKSKDKQNYLQFVKELINEPYASNLDQLYDKNHTSKQIDDKLPKEVDKLFTQNIIHNYEGSWFQLMLKENSVVDFAPQTKVKLVHCKGDDVVPYQISQAALNAFYSLGAKSVELIPLEETLNIPKKLTHVECAPYAYWYAGELFIKDRIFTKGF